MSSHLRAQASNLLLPLFDHHWHFQSIVSPKKQQQQQQQSSGSTDQAVEFYRVFKAFDTNDDGRISKDEVSSIMRKLGHRLSDEDLDLLMLILDLNGDGCLDFDEFLSLYQTSSSRFQAVRAKDPVDSLQAVGGQNEDDDAEDDNQDEDDLFEAFCLFDKNRDGYITAEELHSVLSNLGLVQEVTTSVDACRRMIQVVDSNGDGLVDFHEFKDMMTASSPLCAC